MSNGSLIYRQATADDIPQLKKLAIAAYSSLREQLSPAGWEKMHTGISKDSLYEDLLNTGTGFVCLDGDEVAGTAYLIPQGNPTPIYDASWSYIRMVGVHPAYGGKGIGRMLVALCVSHAKTTGEKIIGLHTSVIMDAARHIYESMGFVQVKELDPLFDVRYWLYRLDI